MQTLCVLSDTQIDEMQLVWRTLEHTAATQRGGGLTCTLVELAGLSDVAPAESVPLSDGRPDPADVVPGPDGVQDGPSVSQEEKHQLLTCSWQMSECSFCFFFCFFVFGDSAP